MTEDTEKAAEKAERLARGAKALEDQARQDGVLPPEPDDDGVGPQTGAVP